MTAHIKGQTVAGCVSQLRHTVAQALATARAYGSTADGFSQLTQLSAALDQLSEQVAESRAWVAASMYDSGQAESLSQLAVLLRVSKSRADQLVKIGRLRGNPVADTGQTPEPPVAIAAIVIMPGLGVLTEHRPDKSPEYTFPVAEVRYLSELGRNETPQEALDRRIPEETGLTVKIIDRIGSRWHPRTDHPMRYYHCELAEPGRAADAGHQPGDTDADAVMWMSAADTRELMRDMFGPVRALIDAELG